MSGEEEADLNKTQTVPLIVSPSKKPHWISKFSGIFYTLIASFLFTSSAFVIKEVGVDVMDALVCRFFLQASITSIFIFYKHYTLFGGTSKQVFLQILCCVMGAGGYFLYFFALSYIDLSDANTLGYTRVVWTVVLSVIVFRERPSMGILIALPLTFLGVAFVTQPTFLFPAKTQVSNNIDSKYRVVGFALAFICALTSSINVILFKLLISTSKNIKPSVLNFQFSMSVLIGLIVYQFYKRLYLQILTPLSYFVSWRFLLASGVYLVTIAASVLTQKAIKREHPAVFSLLGSADIIFALILQNLFTSIRSNMYALIGSALVIGSVVIIGITRILNERAAHRSKEIDEKNGKC